MTSGAGVELGQRVRWLIRKILACVSVGVTATVVVATTISLLPGHSLLQEYVGMLWTNAASRLVVLAVVGLLLALAVRRPWSRPRIAIVVVALVAVTGSVGQVVRIAIATATAGGSVNPFAELFPGAAASPAPDVTEIYHRADGRDLTVSVWKPESGGGPAPVIFNIHGGGWMDQNGNGTEQAAAFGPEAAWYAERGWLAVSVDYRLSDDDHATWDESPADVACALIWTARNAGRFGGDGSRIAVLGGSAGGNLAINLAYSAAQGSAVSSCGGKVPVPAAVVATVPVVDPRNAYDHGVPIPGSEPKHFIGNYIGGTPEDHPDRIAAISSATYLTGHAPPTLIIEPEEDGFIPSEAVFAFAEQARQAGVDVTVAGLPVINHFPFTYDTMANQAIRTITAAFLDRQPLFAPNQGASEK
ncbi:alpha/beta hydrolase [Acrocarpospora catenulata]|uniref:alpha/beta hydrolase n=1 Tax=Acrocarpospora catenulata TaxID=2836182 RepID=UPI001BD998C3|nr:alpha/beta hydrolase [Acrocarpospora catenulata]